MALTKKASNSSHPPYLQILDYEPINDFESLIDSGVRTLSLDESNLNFGSAFVWCIHCALKIRASNSSTDFHPHSLQMITEAIISLKDRSGSSQPAVAKFIEAKYKEFLPPNFKKILSVQLKKLVKSEKIFEINNSYKISANSHKEKTVSQKSDKKAAKMKRLSQVKTPEALKKNVSTTPGKTGGKMKRLSQVKTPERLKKTKSSAPKKGKK